MREFLAPAAIILAAYALVIYVIVVCFLEGRTITGVVACSILVSATVFIIAGIRWELKE